MRIEDSSVCCDVDLVAVARIMLPTPYAEQTHYGWGFLLSEIATRPYIYILFDAKRVNIFSYGNQDNPLCCDLFCLYAAHVATPLHGTTHSIFWDFLRSETARKLLRCDNTNTFRDLKTPPWVLFSLGGRGVARVTVTPSMVKRMAIVAPP